MISDYLLVSFNRTKHEKPMIAHKTTGIIAMNNVTRCYLEAGIQRKVNSKGLHHEFSEMNHKNKHRQRADLIPLGWVKDGSSISL